MEKYVLGENFLVFGNFDLSEIVKDNVVMVKVEIKSKE